LETVLRPFSLLINDTVKLHNLANLNNETYRARQATLILSPVMIVRLSQPLGKLSTLYCVPEHIKLKYILLNKELVRKSEYRFCYIANFVTVSYMT